MYLWLSTQTKDEKPTKESWQNSTRAHSLYTHTLYNDVNNFSWEFPEWKKILSERRKIKHVNILPTCSEYDVD